MTGQDGRGTLLSAFSGAGGLDLGLELAGFDPLVCLDSDPVARHALALNRPGWSVPDEGDVSLAGGSLTARSLGLAPGALDLLAAGPPCQPFSKAGQWSPNARLGMSDPRAACLTGLLDLVAAFLPRAVLLENVGGFLTGPGSALGHILDRLAAVNREHGVAYRLRWWLVDAADYGVPQHRRRAIAVALRDGSDFSLPAPTHAQADQRVRAWDALHDCQEPDLPVATGRWTGLLPAVPEGGNYQWFTARGGGPELFGWRTRYWSFLLKLSRERPSWTLPASPGPNTGPFHWDNRPLSVRERLRLQSFPDEWALAGSPRDQQRLAGNATPPLLAEVLGRALAAQLGVGGPAMDEAPAPVLLRPRLSSVPAPAVPVPVAQGFLDRVGPKDAHPGAGLGPAPRPTRASSPRRAA